MKLKTTLLLVGIAIFLTGCNPALSTNEGHTNPTESTQHVTTDSMPYHQTFYIPTYLNLTPQANLTKLALSATLNIRNTSRKYPIYVYKVDHYNAHGELMNAYLEETVELAPMQTLSYTVKNHKNSRNNTANFAVEIRGAEVNLAPKVDAMMTGYDSENNIVLMTQGILLPHE